MIRYLIPLVISLFAGAAHAEHAHPVKHGFILMGTTEVFAAHIIASTPHNWQVLLALQLPETAEAAYTAAKAATPDGKMILVLDPVDLAGLAGEARLTGTISTEDAAGVRTPVATGVVIENDAFRVLYAEELASVSGE